MSGALVAQAINESIGTAGFQGLDAILKEYLGLIAEQAGTARVPISRTINGHSLASDVDLDNNDVGAAPAGFGLGGECFEVLDWNTATKNGFYSDTNGEERKHSPFLGMAAWGYTVAMKNDDAITQVAFTYATPNWNHALVQKIRHLKGAEGWSEWEWVNPPMEVGVEYRTTERWQGKPVYTKLIYCGLSANGADTNTKISGATPIRFETSIGGKMVSPHIWGDLTDANTAWASLYKGIDGFIHVIIYANSSAVNLETYSQLWYAKD